MLKVAVGVIKNHRGEIIISQRAKNVHQGGLWEFPGGKFEKGESGKQALERELLEELNIEVLSAIPLMDIYYHYVDNPVHLDVYLVDEFKGTAVGMENQPVKWVPLTELKQYDFPVANRAILERLALPRCYPIVDDVVGTEKEMLVALKALISKGYTMIQWRTKSVKGERFKKLAREAIAICKGGGVRLYVNTTLALARELNAEAVHLSANEIKATALPSLADGELFIAASCHSKQELLEAKKKGVLFAVLSPVCATKTHVSAKPLGWTEFSQQVASVELPVYALGGVGPEDFDEAISNGACGVSGIRAFLPQGHCYSETIND
jgi:8-oxo-dGTP diphosphatase